MCSVTVVRAPALSEVVAVLLASAAMSNASMLGAIEREVAGLVASVEPRLVTVRATFSGPIAGIRAESVVNIGSGLLVDSLGYIITSSGVVTHPSGIAFSITVIDHDKHLHDALLYSVDPGLRVAVLYVPTLAGSLPLPTRVRDWYGGAFALVVGNSFGVGPSVLLMTVAGRRERDGFWQLSEPATPGSSGAPVFDSDGALGGIVVGEVAGGPGGAPERPLPAVMVTTQQLRQVIDQLASPAAQQGAPWLGISVRPFVESGGRASLYVSNVFSNSPAAHAGLLPGDVLVRVDTLTLSYVADLAEWIRQRRPGHEVSLHILRNGERRTIAVTVGKR
jgi:serine protease Do